VTIKKNPYAVQVEYLDGKNVKITVTQNGAPLANGKIRVVSTDVAVEKHRIVSDDEAAFAYHPLTSYMPAPQICVKPNDPKVIRSHMIRVPVFIAHELTLDANGSLTVELDADSSWQDKVNADVPAAERYDLEENICKANLTFSVEDNQVKFSEALQGGECDSTPQDN